MIAPLNDVTIEQLIAKQRRFFNSQATKSLAFRLSMLTFLKESIKKHEDEVLEALRIDLNKASGEAFAAELMVVYEEIRSTRRRLSRWMRPKRVAPNVMDVIAKSEVVSEPYGTVLIIAPWNYPFQLAIAPLIGAIAAGNTAVVKPSELTPNVARVVSRILEDAFSAQYVASVEGEADVAQALLQQKWDYIFFTGSTPVGKIVMQHAAKHLTPVTLELGGKSPVIVHEDANIDVAAKRIAWGKWFNAGQTCVAPDYILVHESVEDELIDALQREAFKQYGNGVGVSRYTKIVNERHLNRLRDYLEQGEVVFGGKVDETLQKMAPTVMRNVDVNAPVMQEEIFGPILPVISYRTLEEAVEFVGERPKPLALYLFTETKDVERTVLKRLSFGGGCVNEVMLHVANPSLPFGGVGESGLGAYHGRFSFETFSHKKSIVRGTTKWDIPGRYAGLASAEKLLRAISR